MFLLESKVNVKIRQSKAETGRFFCQSLALRSVGEKMKLDVLQRMCTRPARDRTKVRDPFSMLLFLVNSGALFLAAVLFLLVLCEKPYHVRSVVVRSFKKVERSFIVDSKSKWE